MLYRPDYLLAEAKKQSAVAWDYYVECQETETNDKKLCIARDNYIEAHNKVAAINREIRKRDRTHKKIISKATTAIAK